MQFISCGLGLKTRVIDVCHKCQFTVRVLLGLPFLCLGVVCAFGLTISLLVLQLRTIPLVMVTTAFITATTVRWFVILAGWLIVVIIR